MDTLSTGLDKKIDLLNIATDKLAKIMATEYAVKPDVYHFQKLLGAARYEKNNFVRLYWKLCSYYIAA